MILRRSLSWAGIALIGFVIGGCYNSESDYQALLEENSNLSAELAEAQKENEILTRALDNIKSEEETLQRLHNTGKSGLLAGRAGWPAMTAVPVDRSGGSTAAAPPSTSADPDWTEEWQTPRPAEAVPAPAPAAPGPRPPAAASGGIYVTKPGDVLSNIAAAHHTTVEKILELNPNLRNRRNYMIYDKERLRMP